LQLNRTVAFYLAEPEEETLPLCRQVPKYRRLSGAAERNQKKKETLSFFFSLPFDSDCPVSDPD